VTSSGAKGGTRGTPVRKGGDLLKRARALRENKNTHITSGNRGQPFESRRDLQAGDAWDESL